VTATKRETSLLQTPMSVTVIDRATLEATNADNASDFASLVPGLSYSDSGPGQKRFALRGLQSAGEPEVALFYDEIPISGLPGGSLDTGNDQPDFKLWDVDRVEVLRGPQGTLYGNGSMGGAIRIISNRPVLDQLHGAIQTSISATDGGDPSEGASMMLNLPLVKDKLAIRVTGYYRNEGGWIDDRPQANIALPQIDKNNLNWERTSGTRGSFSLQATDSWNVTGIAYYQRLNTGNTSDLYPGFATASDPYVSKAFVRTPWRDESQMYNLISTYDLDWASIFASGSYQRRTVEQNLDTTRFLLSQFGCNEFNWDQSCFGPPLVPADSLAFESVSAWSGEVRLASRGPGPIQWTVGAFLQTSTTNHLTEVATTNDQGYPQFSPGGVLQNRIFARANVDTFDQYAFFGEGSYDLTDNLKATVGLRWFSSDRTDQQVILQQFFAGQPTGSEPFQEFKEGALFKKFELSYNLGPTGLVYVEAAQGFRAGGPNFPGGFTATAPPYKADSVWDYEVGSKINVLGDKLYWSNAVFHIVWSNLQELVPTALFSYIANAGSAQSDGFESEIIYVPVDGLTLKSGLTYNNARLVGAQPVQSDPTLQLAPGDKLANVPDWTTTASAEYKRPIGGNYVLSTRLDAFYESSRPDIVATKNPAYFIVGSALLFNLHLAVDNGDGWRLGVDVDNLFNGYEPLSGQSLDANLVRSEAAARPRTVSLTLTAKF
jgi:iron complex outermembrane receptor protein